MQIRHVIPSTPHPTTIQSMTFHYLLHKALQSSEYFLRPLMIQPLPTFPSSYHTLSLITYCDSPKTSSVTHLPQVISQGSQKPVQINPAFESLFTVVCALDPKGQPHPLGWSRSLTLPGPSPFLRSTMETSPGPCGSPLGLFLQSGLCFHLGGAGQTDKQSNG